MRVSGLIVLGLVLSVCASAALGASAPAPPTVGAQPNSGPAPGSTSLPSQSQGQAPQLSAPSAVAPQVAQTVPAAVTPVAAPSAPAVNVAPVVSAAIAPAQQVPSAPATQATTPAPAAVAAPPAQVVKAVSIDEQVTPPPVNTDAPVYAPQAPRLNGWIPPPSEDKNHVVIEVTPADEVNDNMLLNAVGQRVPATKKQWQALAVQKDGGHEEAPQVIPKKRLDEFYQTPEDPEARVPHVSPTHAAREQAEAEKLRAAQLKAASHPTQAAVAAAKAANGTVVPANTTVAPMPAITPVPTQHAPVVFGVHVHPVTPPAPTLAPRAKDDACHPNPCVTKGFTLCVPKKSWCIKAPCPQYICQAPPQPPVQPAKTPCDPNPCATATGTPYCTPKPKWCAQAPCPQYRCQDHVPLAMLPEHSLKQATITVACTHLVKLFPDFDCKRLSVATNAAGAGGILSGERVNISPPTNPEDITSSAIAGEGLKKLLEVNGPALVREISAMAQSIPIKNASSVGDVKTGCQYEPSKFSKCKDGWQKRSLVPVKGSLALCEKREESRPCCQYVVQAPTPCRPVCYCNAAVCQSTTQTYKTLVPQQYTTSHAHCPTASMSQQQCTSTTTSTVSFLQLLHRARVHGAPASNALQPQADGFETYGERMARIAAEQPCF